MTAVPLTSVHALRNIISIRPLGLFSDIDGTLAPIVSRPEDARVTPKCRELLGRLLDCGVRVALITGRTPGTARLMTGLDRVVYAANHGMTLWMDGVDETTEAVAGYVALAGAVARELAGINAVGVTVEHTGPNVAVHYRRAADEVTARAGIIEAIAASPSARSFRVREGRKVFELRPPLPINKGTALEGLVRRFGMRGLLCLGDDQTDVDMFAAVAQLRDEGLRGASGQPARRADEEDLAGRSEAGDPRDAERLETIRGALERGCGVLRNRDDLEGSLAALENTRRDVENDAKMASFVGRASIVATAIATCALRREESRGDHFRTDFPSRDDQRWLGNQLCVIRPDGKLGVWYEGLAVGGRVHEGQTGDR